MVYQTPAYWRSLGSEYHPPGTLPGTLREDCREQSCCINLTNYGKGFFKQNNISAIDELSGIKRDGVNWLQVSGIPDRKSLETLGELFELHPLSLEDVANGGQHSKIEDFGSYLYIVLYALPSPDDLEPVQVNLFLGSDYVINICRQGNKIFEMINQQIKLGQGIIRQQGAGYLCYSLCDAVVDHFFPILENLGEQLSLLEERTFGGATSEIIEAVHALNVNLFLISRLTMEAQEVLGEMQGAHTEHIDSSLGYYLRDVLDHTHQLARNLESYRQIADSILNSYLSLRNHEMNEIMKVLTIIATIFIPLTFIVGVYGMNFRTDVSPFNMPELSWRYGYPAIWGIMLLLVGFMLLRLRRKKWI